MKSKCEVTPGSESRFWGKLKQLSNDGLLFFATLVNEKIYIFWWAKFSQKKVSVGRFVQCDAIRWEQFLRRCRLGQR